jgi:hypothetical protein
MLIELEPEKEVSFLCPTGLFDAVLAGVKPELDTSHYPPKQLIKFIFDVEVPTMPDKLVKVIKRVPYSSKPNSLLRKMLKCWLGRELLKKIGEQFSTEALLGQRAQLVIQHMHNEGYENPYVMVESILPPGTLTEANVLQMAA